MKRTYRSTGPDAATVQAVKNRSGGLCERCWLRSAKEVHHRTPRGQGGSRNNSRINRCDNLVHLCSPCHRSEVEMDRDQARRDGWLWPRGEFDRGEVRAVRLGSASMTGGRFVLLTPDGRYEDLPPEA